MFKGSIPESQVERAALLNDCLERWFGAANSGALGVPEAAWTEAEQRLSVSLPSALREWYLASGARRDVWCLQDRLLAPSDFEWRGEMLVFCVENQGVVRWGVERASLHLPDPPVFVSDPWKPDRWLCESKHVSEFALVFAAMNAKWSKKVPYRADVELSPDVLAALVEALERLPLPELHFPEFPTRFYGGEEAIVEVHGKSWAWVTAHGDEAFEQIAEVVEQAGGEPLELVE